jgi:outer membrane lipoprotein-sorting protein
MTSLTGSRALRAAVPAAAVAAIAVAASGVFSADANPPLPARTAAQLLVDVQSARVDGPSGTIVQNANLGLPNLPNVGSGKGASSSLTSLLTGSHTLRVWAAGEDKQRLALLGTLGESDVVHNGRDVWVWRSDTNTATHYRLPPPDAAEKSVPSPVPGALTPQQAADRALRAIDPTTSVTTDGTSSVAHRPVYELVLRPRDARSLVGQVRIALDAATHLPLRVQIFPQASDAGAAFEVGYTRVSFTVPGDEQFRFTAPPGATVTEGHLSELYGESGTGRGADGSSAVPATPLRPEQKHPVAPDSAPAVRTVGTGWTAVLVLSGVGNPPTGAGSGAGSASGRPVAELAALLDRLPRVSGSWGSGRLLTSTLVSAVLTDDGRLAIGAVQPDLLYQALGQR